jgi:hypothetical protein
MLKFDFEIAKKLADIESKESVKKYIPTLVKANNKTRSHKTVATS